MNAEPRLRVHLLQELGPTGAGTLWSAEGPDGTWVTVEVLPPPPAGRHGWDLSGLERLEQHPHPALALPYAVGTLHGPAVVLQPRIGQGLPLPGHAGDPTVLAAAGLRLAAGLAHLHAAGLAHQAVAPSLLCPGPDGQPQLAVTAAVLQPADDLTALQHHDVAALRDCLLSLDVDAGAVLGPQLEHAGTAPALEAALQAALSDALVAAQPGYQDTVPTTATELATESAAAFTAAAARPPGPPTFRPPAPTSDVARSDDGLTAPAMPWTPGAALTTGHAEPAGPVLRPAGPPTSVPTRLPAAAKESKRAGTLRGSARVGPAAGAAGVTRASRPSPPGDPGGRRRIRVLDWRIGAAVVGGVGVLLAVVASQVHHPAGGDATISPTDAPTSAALFPQPSPTGAAPPRAVASVAVAATLPPVETRRATPVATPSISSAVPRTSPSRASRPAVPLASASSPPRQSRSTAATPSTPAVTSPTPVTIPVTTQAAPPPQTPVVAPPRSTARPTPAPRRTTARPSTRPSPRPANSRTVAPPP